VLEPVATQFQTCECTTCIFNVTARACEGKCQRGYACARIPSDDVFSTAYYSEGTSDESDGDESTSDSDSDEECDGDAHDTAHRRRSHLPKCTCLPFVPPPPPTHAPPTPRPTPAPTPALAPTPAAETLPPAPIGCCNEPPSLHIVECTRVEVTQLSNCTYAFQVDVNFARHTVNVVSFTPVDACALKNRTACDNIAANFTQSYCELSNVTRASWHSHDLFYSANNWTASLHDAWSARPYTRFTRIFSLEELIACGGAAPVMRGDHLVYEGTLYAAAVYVEHCERLDAGECDASDDETSVVRFQQPYHFEIDFASNGTLSIELLAKRTHFSIEWIKNTWLPSGDIVVELETCIDRVGVVNTTTWLTAVRADGSIDDDEPADGASLLQVLDYSDCLASHPHRCCQRVYLGSQNTNGTVSDFSGDRYLTFDVEDSDGTRHGSVHAYLELDIKHGPNSTHIDATAEATARIFRDRSLSEPYAFDSQRHSTFIDCEEACVLVEVPCPPGAAAVVDAAELCTGDTADPLPYDPAHPQTTGCNTRDIGLRVYDLFDRDRNFSSPQFDVSFPASAHAWQYVFCFRVHALSCRAQTLQLHYRLALANGTAMAPRTVDALSTSRQTLSLALDAPKKRSMGAMRLGASVHATTSALDTDADRLDSRLRVVCPPSQRFDEVSHACVASWWGGSWHGDDDAWFGVARSWWIWGFVVVACAVIACALCVCALPTGEARVHRHGHSHRHRRSQVSFAPASVLASTSTQVRFRGAPRGVVDLSDVVLEL
jgi:hypothetical protein